MGVEVVVATMCHVMNVRSLLRVSVCVFGNCRHSDFCLSMSILQTVLPIQPLTPNSLFFLSKWPLEDTSRIKQRWLFVYRRGYFEAHKFRIHDSLQADHYLPRDKPTVPAMPISDRLLVWFVGEEGYEHLSNEDILRPFIYNGPKKQGSYSSKGHLSSSPRVSYHPYVSNGRQSSTPAYHPYASNSRSSTTGTKTPTTVHLYKSRSYAGRRLHRSHPTDNEPPRPLSVTRWHPIPSSPSSVDHEEMSVDELRVWLAKDLEASRRALGLGGTDERVSGSQQTDADSSPRPPASRRQPLSHLDIKKMPVAEVRVNVAESVEATRLAFE